ncbi:MAG: hypothetical protein I3273_04140 [Candidatus Moeniiplasma glomeromycotorum]|nr:hypothetical protein [Candidatus Moeniiplasma glomeromycotorum]
MFNKEKWEKEKNKRKPLFKCWGWCKKHRKTSYCPRCIDVLWGWILLVIVLIGIIIFLIIYILKKK